MKTLVYSTDSELHDVIASLTAFPSSELDPHLEFTGARNAFDEHHHELVLVHAQNADDDGLSLCRKIRAVASKSQCVIVMLAPDEDPFLHRTALQAGADDVVDCRAQPDLLDVRLAASRRRAVRLQRALDSEHTTIALQKAMDRMQLGVTITDLEGRILYANEADARIHGYQAEELIGQNVRAFAPPEDWNAMSPDKARDMKSWRRESRNVRKDGTVFPVQLLSDVVVDGSGEPVAIVTVCEDISERKQMEQELGTDRDELNSRVRERTTELLEANIRLQHEILERRRVERQLLYEALHDSLTDLPNRALFYDRLSRVLAGSSRHPKDLFGVLYLNVDQYKAVTESLGPEAGDRLLVQAAQRLRNSVRPEDTIGSAGGDEFLVLVEDLRDANDVTRVARRIQDSLAAPMEVGGQTVFTTASIGISMSSTVYERPEDMIRDAQVAMFRSQAGSGSGHVIFDRQMHDRALTRLKLEMELRQALERQLFRVHYQPIVSLETGLIEGFEALARWRLGDGDSVSPIEFITLAEETGTIFDLERQILERVCRDLKRWRETISSTGPYVSVNLSGKELANPGLAELVGGILSDHEVKAEWLRFEVTESAIVENADVAADVLTDLKDLGVAVYIDDFGTGYSSLSCLHSYPIDTLKIDQSFVSGRDGRPGNWEIVRVIIGLAEALKLDVIAEGIETEEQRKAIADLGCKHGQGFLFSRPVCPAEVERLLASPDVSMAV